MLPNAEVLAHQGGWDEALMVVVPLGVFAGLLWAATRRAPRDAEDAGTGDADRNGRR